jgi:hypothetical protein
LYFNFSGIENKLTGVKKINKKNKLDKKDKLPKQLEEILIGLLIGIFVHPEPQKILD